MKNICSFVELIDHLRARGERRRVAVVWASDESTQNAVAQAVEEGFADAVFIGCREEVLANPRLSGSEHVEIIDVADPDEAAAKAVELVREGNADVIMKGMINTDNLLRAVLNKEKGILPKGRVLTHLTASKINGYDKLLFFSDPAVIPYPTDEQRHAQVEYLLETTRKFGIECPKIALIHCSEKVDERHFPFTADYRHLAEAAAAGQYGCCVIDGPLDVKTALSPEALKKKHLESPVNGEADALIFPDIEAGNTFYKTITLFAGAEIAGMLCGPSAPVILASRGDSSRSKFNSIAMASL